MQELKAASSDSRAVSNILEEFQSEFDLNCELEEKNNFKHRFFINFSVDFVSGKKYSEDELYLYLSNYFSKADLTKFGAEGIDIGCEGYELFVEADDEI